MVANPSRSLVITRIEFNRFKTLKQFSVTLQKLNILTGPNNSGKSTIINALRALSAGIKKANAKSPEIVTDENGLNVYGYRISSDNIPTSLENAVYEYEDGAATVVFRLSNNTILKLVFSGHNDCTLIAEASRQIKSPTAFRSIFPISIYTVPILGPVDHDEEIILEETVKKNLETHRAARNFRNYWYLNKLNFNEFAEMLSATWPGMEITPPERSGYNKLSMFCLENNKTRELYWSGFGFQIWCQILSHITRASNATLIAIDEPEIYLHPDMQRQLLSILRTIQADVVIATHSTEIIAEADPSDVLIINKEHRAAKRLKNISDLQSAFNILGSNQNVSLTKLARTRKVLFVEDESDYKLLLKFSSRYRISDQPKLSRITPIKSGGFSSWKEIRTIAAGIERVLGQSLQIGAIYDRDYYCDEEIQHITDELNTSLDLVHYTEVKEIENFLLNPTVLNKVFLYAIEQQAKRGDKNSTIPYPDFEVILQDIATELKEEVSSKYFGKYVDFQKSTNPGIDTTTLMFTANQRFSLRWKDETKRISMLPGKQVLKRIRDIAANHNISLTDSKIIDQFAKTDFSPDLVSLLNKISHFSE